MPGAVGNDRCTIEGMISAWRSPKGAGGRKIEAPPLRDHAHSRASVALGGNLAAGEVSRRDDWQSL